MSAPNTGHRPQLDTVRFFAFLGVFVYHFNERAFGYGCLGVPLFFVLSGFLITRLLLVNESGDLRHDLGVFFARRTLRIFPLYYLVLIVLLLAGRLEYPWWHFLYLHNVLMFLLPLSHEPGITGHFWSLSVEEQFYLLYPLLLLTTPSASRVPMLMALLVGSLVSRLTLHLLYPDSRFWALLPVQGEYLVWGCFAGLFDVTQRETKIPVNKLLVLGLLLHAIAAADQFALHWIHRPGSAGLYQSLHGSGFALVVLSLWRLPAGWLKRLLTLPPLVYLGQISYGLYVFHNLCYGVDVPLVKALPWLAMVPGPLLVFAVVVGLAMLSWHLVEGPINGLKAFVPYRKPAAPAEPALVRA
jgi:peptidoglycan/LPS O-acetylase OafA/YrhL